MTHIVSFDDGDSGQFSRMERSDSTRSYGSPSELSNVSPSDDSLLGRSRSKLDTNTDMLLAESSLEQSMSSVRGASQELAESSMEQSFSSVRGASREASIASGMSGNFSDSRQPRNGSFSSADFELRYRCFINHS